MGEQLEVSIGQYSTRGRKDVNQDFHGVVLPPEPARSSKGIAVALADGISSSNVSQIASETAVKAFLEEYYCTPDVWSVKKSVQQVLNATNSWLYAQTRQSQFRYDQDRGYVCTFTGVVFKSATAHVFHAGDSRIYHLRDSHVEQLTVDHRVSVSREQCYLTRALGFHTDLEIEFNSISIGQGDHFVFLTDGVYEYIDAGSLAELFREYHDDLNAAARAIVDKAFDQGSDDNLTAQVVRIDSLPIQTAEELYQSLTGIPFPPELGPNTLLDGYQIVRQLHVGSRSHVHLAIEQETGLSIVIKTPSVEMRDDPAYLDAFVAEEWIARRISNPHVLKCSPTNRKRNYLYTVAEYVEGQTLGQWMRDNSVQPLESVRGIIEQIGKGLQAFHRLEMLHQDLRPENIMIDPNGTIKIIDFGSTQVAGIVETITPIDRSQPLGTVQYMAPEYLLGQPGTPTSDIYSLGVIAYQLLTGELPYGPRMARARTRSAQWKVKYKSALNAEREIPVWVDGALRRAVHFNPLKRYQEISEFLYDMRHPRREFVQRPPLIERDPATFWKRISIVLAIGMALLLTVLLLSNR